MLKRSNAKLQKKAQDAVSPSLMVKVPASEDPLKKPSKKPVPIRQPSGGSVRPPKASGASSSKDNRPETSHPRLPKPFWFKAASASTSTPQDVSDADQEPRQKSSVFSKLTRKFAKDVSDSKRVSPPDNFTRWDNEHRKGRYSLPASNPNNPRRSEYEASSSVDLGMPGMAYRNLYDDAALAQDTWSRQSFETAASELNGEEDDLMRFLAYPRRGGRGIDWAHLTLEDIEAELALYEQHIPDPASPTDSGVELPDEPPYEGKGKGRLGSIVAEGSSKAGNRVDDVRAQELKLALDMKRKERETKEQHQEWASRLRIIAFLKEERLEEQRRAEEERLLQERIREQEEFDAAAAKRIQEEEERIAAELASHKTCICCSDSMHPLDFPAQPGTTACSHPSQTCTECMHQWLSSEFNDKGSEGIKCAECPQVLAFEDIKRLASEETFTAYERQITRNALSSLEEFAWCLSPTCSFGQLNYSGEKNYMKCASCNYEACLSHLTPWHKGETCTQYDYRTSGAKAKDEESKTAAMLDTVSKLCPGPNCGWRIQKIDGCDHMTCKKCKFEWCWECRASHREIKRVGNTAHEGWCKFHSDNLKVAWPFNVHA